MPHLDNTATPAAANLFCQIMQHLIENCQGSITSAHTFRSRRYYAKKQMENGKPTWGIVEAKG